MKTRRIYIDTSVIGGCHDREFATWSNGLMRDFQLGNFKPILSETLEYELRPAPANVRETFAELLALDHEMLRVTPEVLALAGTYLDRRILTR
jgi:hypothetical protein